MTRQVPPPPPGDSELLWMYGVLALYLKATHPPTDEVAATLAADYHRRWNEKAG
jgi:hypothetical protein